MNVGHPPPNVHRPAAPGGGNAATMTATNPAIQLNEIEKNRFNELDSRLFGFMSPRTTETLQDYSIISKGIQLLEKELIEGQRNRTLSDEGQMSIFIKLGHFHLLSHDFPKAMSAYQLALELDNGELWKDLPFYYGLGLVYHHFRAYRHALRAFQHLLYVGPNWDRIKEVHVRLGLIHEELEEWDCGILHLRGALLSLQQNSPPPPPTVTGNSDSNSGAGVEPALSHSQQSQAAHSFLSATTKVTTLTPDQIKFHIGLCYDEKGDFPRARQIYEELIAAASTTPLNATPLPISLKAGILRQLGWLIYRSEPPGGGDDPRRIPLALQHLNESSRLEPGSGKTFYYLGRVYSSIQGKAHDAFVNYRYSIDKSEASADTWCSIGVLYQQQQQPMDALQAFVCAVQLDRSHWAAWIDLALLYESLHQFPDALHCFKQAAKHKPPTQQALNARIQLLASEVRKAPTLSHIKQPKPQLPSLQEAWKLPIPAELTQRQENFLKQKQDGYMNIGGLMGMDSEVDGDGKPLPPYFLTPQQIQMMHIMEQSQATLNLEQQRILRQLQDQYHAMEEQIKLTQNRNSGTQHPHQHQPDGVGVSGGPQKLNELPQIGADDIDSVLGGGVGVGAGEPPSPSSGHQPVPKERTRTHQPSTNSTDDFLSALGGGESSDEGGGGTTGKNDPMLSSAALSKDPTTGAAGHQGVGGAGGGVVGVVGADIKPEIVGGGPASLQDTCVTSSSELSAVSGASGNHPNNNNKSGPSSNHVNSNNNNSIGNNNLITPISVRTANSNGPADGQVSNEGPESLLSPGGTLTAPPPLNLMSQLFVPLTLSGKEVLELARTRATHAPTPTDPEPVNNNNNNNSSIEDSTRGGYKLMFAEHSPPPVPPWIKPPGIGGGAGGPPPIPKDKLQLPTPVVYVDSKKDALAPELQQFCYQSQITLIKNLTASLRMDLGLYSTKTLVGMASNEQVEVRTQMRMAPEVNLNAFGESQWEFESTKAFTTIGKYANYQAQTFQHLLREEQEKLRSGKVNKEELNGGGGTGDTGVGWGGSTNNNSTTKKSSFITGETKGPFPYIKFGTNVDLSEEGKWSMQIDEINKLPPFLRLHSSANLLTHIGHPVFGMNTLQLYMKVPGCRTPAHQENLNFSAVNINIGPGDCEWLAVPKEYWGHVYHLCQQRGINYLSGSWWPPLEDLWDADIPVYRFTQKAGDVVWVNTGCVHWVQSTGWSNNIAYNVGAPTQLTMAMSLERYELNRFHGFKSIVPVQHLFWQLARNIAFTDPKVYNIVKGVLLRSLAYVQMSIDFLQSKQKQLRIQSRNPGECSPYCSVCEMEVFCILLVREEANGKYAVFCLHCARRCEPILKSFIVLQQYSVQDLTAVYDQTQLNSSRIGVFC